MPMKPARRALVLMLLVLFASLAPASVAVARPLSDDDHEIAAGAPRPLSGLWTLLLEVVERLVGVFAADAGPGPTTTSGVTLNPDGTPSSGSGD